MTPATAQAPGMAPGARPSSPDRSLVPDPALHPQDERAYVRSDIYRLSTAAAGSGWSAQLPNNLTTAAFGTTVNVPVYVTRTPGSAPSATVKLTATSVSNPQKTATSTCKMNIEDTGD